MRKIVSIFICTLLLITSILSVSGNTNINKSFIKNINPDGLFIYSADASGSCGIAWGYINESFHTSDAYIESGTGKIFSFGSMLFHEENDDYANFIRDNYSINVIWRFHGITFLISSWEHDGVKNSIAVLLKPQKETIAGFSPNETAFLILTPGFSEQIEPYLLKFSGIHRSGSKVNIVKGTALLMIVKEENTGDIHPEPIIAVFLIVEEEGGIIDGKYNPLLIGAWLKNGGDVLGFTIEAANTFNVFYKTF